MTDCSVLYERAENRVTVQLASLSPTVIYARLPENHSIFSLSAAIVHFVSLFSTSITFSSTKQEKKIKRHFYCLLDELLKPSMPRCFVFVCFWGFFFVKFATYTSCTPLASDLYSQKKDMDAAVMLFLFFFFNLPCCLWATCYFETARIANQSLV